MSLKCGCPGLVAPSPGVHTKTGLWGHFLNEITFDWKIVWTSGFVLGWGKTLKNSGKIKNRARRCSKNRFFRYNGHFLNLAPRFRAIEPPDRPGLNLRLVVRLNHPICHQNEPKNVHYLPVVAPRMILQDAPNNDFQVLGPFARSCAPPLPLQGAGEAPIGSL